MKFLKHFGLIAFVFFLVLFLLGCSVEASTKTSNEKCIITTSSVTYKNINKETIKFDSYEYVLNFRNNDGKSVSTNSFTTICDGNPY